MVRHATATLARLRLGAILRAGITAVRSAVTIPIHQVIAVIKAVGNAITICIAIVDTTATSARLCLVGISWAAIDTVCQAIAVAVIIRGATTTGTALHLGAILGAAIVAVSHAIAITVMVSHATATAAG